MCWMRWRVIRWTHVCLSRAVAWLVTQVPLDAELSGFRRDALPVLILSPIRSRSYRRGREQRELGLLLHRADYAILSSLLRAHGSAWTGCSWGRIQPKHFGING